MTNVIITTTLEDNMWILSFKLSDPADIPRDIFIFENVGTGLGEYQGVCSLEDYRRFQTYTSGQNIPVFGNKFVKCVDGIMSFSIDVDPAPIRAKIVADVKAFKLSYTTGQSTTTTFNI